MHDAIWPIAGLSFSFMGHLQVYFDQSDRLFVIFFGKITQAEPLYMRTGNSYCGSIQCWQNSNFSM
jgi:hypothetical protein